MIRSRSERARRKREPSGVMPWDVAEMVSIPLHTHGADLSPGYNLQIVLGRVDRPGPAHVHLFALHLAKRHVSRSLDVVDNVLDLLFRMQRMCRDEDRPVQDLQGTRAHILGIGLSA